MIQLVEPNVNSNHLKQLRYHLNDNLSKEQQKTYIKSKRTNTLVDFEDEDRDSFANIISSHNSMAKSQKVGGRKSYVTRRREPRDMQQTLTSIGK